MNVFKYINDTFKDTPDLVERKIKYSFSCVHIYYIETICSSEQINNFILKNLTNPNGPRRFKDILAGPNFKEIDLGRLEFYLYNGFTALVYKGKIYVIETKASLDRSVSFPEIEQDLYGAKDALLENYQKNIGLIKRRLKSSHLKTKEYKLGRFTQTATGVLYVDNITDMSLVKRIDALLNKIDTDSVIDVGELKQFLTMDKGNVFPPTKLTERPDVIVKALLDGKLVIVMDTSPFAIILPAVLADFINPISDKYLYQRNANNLKILRMICFFLTIFTPAFYIAIITYNQETIPASLLTNFITQNEGIPFPATIETFFMIFICEMLRESDIRFPNNFSSSISILGALILGDAAVSANIVSPIMIIITALTFISSMIFSNVELSGAIRIWRFITMIISSFYGLYGVALAFIFFIVSLSSYSSFGLPYTFPVVPFSLPYLKETLYESDIHDNKKRSPYLTKNIRKQR
ncbi:spore germination protein GerKA [Clostridium sp. CAG:533]|nr:spore germination protein GerKA [Clostridium sp. CAG:533]